MTEFGKEFRTQMRSQSRSSGISLIELLIATVIFTILLLGFTSLFTFALKSWINTVGRFGNIQNIGGAFDILASDLRSSLPPYATCSDIAFLGYDEAALAPTLTNSIQDELIFVCASYTSSEGQYDGVIGNELVKRGYWLRRDLTDDTRIQQGRDIATFNDYCPEITYGFSIQDEFAYSVSKFDVEYYDGTTWTDEWSSATEGALPKLVRVTITSTKSGISSTATMVIYPRARGTYLTK